MKKLLIICLAVFYCTISAQTIFVSPETGNDNNSGSKNEPFKTLRAAAQQVNKDNSIRKVVLLPGLHILNEKIVFNNVYSEESPLVIQAETLPDDTSWSHQKMPIILSVAAPTINFGFLCAIGIEVAANHISVKGIKFLGSPLPEIFYYAIARQGKSLTGLEVSQCMFLGDEDAATLQGAVLAHGHAVKVKHSVFKGCQNNIILWDVEEGKRKGCEIRNSIFTESEESTVWTVMEDEDLIFKNNIAVDNNIFWVHQAPNNTIYKLQNSYVVNSGKYIVSYVSGMYNDSELNYVELNVNKKVDFTLRGKEFLGMPNNFLHPENDIASEIKAGLFTTKKPGSN